MRKQQAAREKEDIRKLVTLRNPDEVFNGARKAKKGGKLKPANKD
jgi:hypothetical protein